MNQPSALAASASRCIAAVLLCAAMSAAQAAVTVSLTAPADGSQYTTPANITLSATASASGGYTVSKVEFFYGTTLIGTDFASPYSIAWNNAPPGQHALTAKATAIKKNSPDDTATSTVVNITVSAPQAQLYFIHADHLATPRLVANAAGTAVWKWNQEEPFGNNVADENPSGLGAFDLPLRLPGQYLDKETNLHYNYFRDYDSGIGRYVQSDPIGLRGGLNTYAYVGSPLLLTDARGLVGDDIGGEDRPRAPLGLPDITGKAQRDLARRLSRLLCPPDCWELQGLIKERADDLRQRYFTMLNDPKDLYRKAYCEPSLGRRIGTWLGHGDQLKQKRENLRKLIEQADAMNCPVDPQDRDLLTIEPPECPAAR